MEFDPAILSVEERVGFALRALYHRCGYKQYRMRKFEEYELYVRNKDFLLSPEVISFTDADGKLLALKPDVTLSIVRSARPVEGQTLKLYYDENVYRIAKGSGGFRELRQVGLECLGAVDEEQIGEVLRLACESLRVISSESVLCLSHLGIVGACLDEAALSDEGRKAALGFLAEKNAHELRALCRAEHTSEDAAARLALLAECSGEPEAVLSRLREAGCENDAVAEIGRITASLRQSGITRGLSLDFSVLGDMRYYNGVAFRGFVRGLPNSVVTGGQYDRLLRRMGKGGGAIGFACCLDALERLERGSGI